MAKKSKIPQGVYNAHVHHMTHEGRGVADIDGKKVFIAGALPGEDVSFEYKYVRRRLSQGIVCEITNPSPSRVEPKCPHFHTCGGCAIQHMAPDAAFAFKQEVVLEQLAHFAKLKPEVLLPALKGPSFGYRTKARLGVRDVAKKGGVLVGFREKFSNRIAMMDSCEVLHPSIGKIIEPLKTMIAQLSICHQVPQVEVAVGDDASVMILRHLEPMSEQDITIASAFCKEYGLWLYLQPKGIDSVKKVYPNDGKEHLHYHLKSQGITIAFHPTDFTQVNVDINQQMIDAALEQLSIQPDEKVLDLFCGIGNFTLPLAQVAQTVVGVEGSDTAIERAKANAATNDLAGKTSFFVENLFADKYNQGWASQTFDKILLDPPRSGAEQVLPWIAKQPVSKVLYVSCNPATLARDSGILAGLGFKLKTLRVMDMFPHTAHVESMALFERG